MVGVLPSRVSMRPLRMSLAYAEVMLTAPGLLGGRRSSAEERRDQEDSGSATDDHSGPVLSRRDGGCPDAAVRCIWLAGLG